MFVRFLLFLFSFYGILGFLNGVWIVNYIVFDFGQWLTKPDFYIVNRYGFILVFFFFWCIQFSFLNDYDGVWVVNYVVFDFGQWLTKPEIPEPIWSSHIEMIKRKDREEIQRVLPMFFFFFFFSFLLEPIWSYCPEMIERKEREKRYREKMHRLALHKWTKKEDSRNQNHCRNHCRWHRRFLYS